MFAGFVAAALHCRKQAWVTGRSGREARQRQTAPRCVICRNRHIAWAIARAAPAGQQRCWSNRAFEAIEPRGATSVHVANQSPRLPGLFERGPLRLHVAHQEFRAALERFFPATRAWRRHAPE